MKTSVRFDFFLLLPPQIWIVLYQLRKSQMGKIRLKDIRLFAYHGCLEEEGIIGSDYLVNLTIHADLNKASRTDLLKDTVDYVNLKNIVKREMDIRSKLLEHVAQRIIDTILEELPDVLKIKVSIAKKNPPIGGDVSEVRVIMKGKR